MIKMEVVPNATSNGIDASYVGITYKALGVWASTYTCLQCKENNPSLLCLTVSTEIEYDGMTKTIPRYFMQNGFHVFSSH